MIYLEGQALTSDVAIAERLALEHRLVGKKIGLSKKSRQNKQFTEPPFLFDEYSTTYIWEHKLVDLEDADQTRLKEMLSSVEYKVFRKFRQTYYLINGSKFGGLFLAYRQDPSKNHAEAIIFISGSVIELSRSATIAKKTCIYVNPSSLQSYQIKFKPNVPQII